MKKILFGLVFLFGVSFAFSSNVSTFDEDVGAIVKADTLEDATPTLAIDFYDVAKKESKSQSKHSLPAFVEKTFQSKSNIVAEDAFVKYEEPKLPDIENSRIATLLKNNTQSKAQTNILSNTSGDLSRICS